MRDILQTLEATGQAQETLVLFSSEQGSQFPGCKWTNWDTGLHTALIARWPGVVPVGKRTDAMVQYVDVLPTLLELAGAGPAPAGSWNDPATYALVQRYMKRPAESLYRTTADPYELTDLMGRPQYQGMAATLSAELDRWMEQQHDPGALQDTHEAFQAAKKRQHRPFSAVPQ